MALKSRQEITTESRAPLKIGEVAKQSGFGIEALRFYERSGLLGRPGRTQSGYRLYDAGVLERLDFIKRAQVLGFSLDEIKQIIAERQSGQSPCAEVRQLVRTRLQELDEQMREMRRYGNELSATLAQWENTGDVEGHICGLIEASNIKHEGLQSVTKLQRNTRKRKQ